MVKKPKFGSWISIKKINKLNNFGIITVQEPWEILEPKITTTPKFVVYNNNMALSHLEELYKSLRKFIKKDFSLIGIGGGSPCDTAKYIAWKMANESKKKVDLFLMPSIISVDAFLCSSIAVRVNGKVNYIGESAPEEILVDYELIKKAPKFLNRAGVSDTISITSALGDWKIAVKENNDNFDQSVFNRAREIAKDLMDARTEIKKVSDKGIKSLVQGFYNEVKLCEEWGNARPEEGSEHFLAYCLESITKKHYIHGNLIGLNILISLYLQEDNAVFPIDDIHQFFDDINLNFKPEEQNISYASLQKALLKVQDYVVSEDLFYSIYNSPQLILSEEKVEEIINFVKSL
ncbi:MAG: putative Glycerol-1-phosphate dehydrogenase [NAD(P)+] [Promethearchaeota archaeon]|nr:MAG: putative Glycerol-1-phosphate dehydrogenase [NAD(P)+] [Candidatus Lokiarchaeota archaeon]